MQTTRSNQGAHRTSWFAQLFIRYPIVVGFILMFALTWPLDLGLAAQSRGLLTFYIPPILGLFVGYGFVAGALVMTGIVTRGSLLMALLFHAAVNTAEIFLPILPSPGGDSRPLLIAMGLRCVTALVVVIVAGPNLGWQPAAQLEVISPAVAAG
jgi:hypothetical protein